MSDFKVGDRVRRIKPCVARCGYPPHQVGWEGVVDKVLGSNLVVDDTYIPKKAAEKVEKVEKDEKDEDPIAEDVEDERIAAWETIIKLKSAGTETSDALPLSAAPNPAIRLEVLKLTLAHYGDLLTAKKIVKVADEFAAWIEGR